MSDFSQLLRPPRGSLFDRAQDAAHWRALFAPVDALDATGVALGGPKDDVGDIAATAKADVCDAGVFVTPPVVSPSALVKTQCAIECVEASGWPPVFAFMHDAPWELLASEAMQTVLRAVLGDGALQLPGLWAKRVSGEGDAGWSPHVDVSGPPALRADHRPARLSIWIPLTDATVDNGCMFVVPEKAAPALSLDFDRQQTLPINDVIRILHHARPLPAAAGSVLGWRTTTLHWGGQHRGGSVPDRLSIALEFGHPLVPLRSEELPAFGLGLRPDFRSRLALVGRSLVMYGAAQDREPHAFNFVNLGRQLMAVVDG